MTTVEASKPTPQVSQDPTLHGDRLHVARPEAVMEEGKSLAILSGDALETEDGDTTRPAGVPLGAAGPALGSEDTVASKAPRLMMERTSGADLPPVERLRGRRG